MTGNYYFGKKILVAGGSGMIGNALTRKLLALGANITIASLEKKSYVKTLFKNSVKFIQTDLTDFDNCLKVTKKKDLVFNLLGIKGSVGIGESKVASFLIPMLRFQTNLMDASFKNGVSGFLFISSICAYPQSSKPKKEETVWDKMPKQNDRIPGLAKRIGEIQGETYMKEYGWEAVKIIRPSNVYGPFDDFNPNTAQVIPSLIARTISGENPLKIWGDGSVLRDFVYVEDVADGALLALEKAPACLPINIGAGRGISIRDIASTILKNSDRKVKIEWDTTKPTGDPIRVLDITRAKTILGFSPKYDLEDGINKTIKWYITKYNKILKLKG